MLASIFEKVENTSMSEIDTIDVMALHHEFADTEHGQRLAAQVRYERYKPEDVTNARWEAVLGADVNNLRHMHLTWGLTKVMVQQMGLEQPGFLDEPEGRLLEVAAIIHDRAEAVVGDISYSLKTAAQEDEEKAVLANMVTNSHDIVKDAADKIVFDNESKLGLVFNSVERMGYLRTALRAARHVREQTATDCDDGLRWLVADVLGSQPVALISRAELHLPVKKYLLNVAGEVSLAFQVPLPQDFINYHPADREGKLFAFTDAQAAWFAAYGSYSVQHTM